MEEQRRDLVCQYLAESLRMARHALADAVLILHDAETEGLQVNDLRRLVLQHSHGIRGVECLVDVLRSSTDCNQPMRTQDA